MSRGNGKGRGRRVLFIVNRYQSPYLISDWLLGWGDICLPGLAAGWALWGGDGRVGGQAW